MSRAAFFAALRKRKSGLFGASLTQAQVDGISGILDDFGTHGDGLARPDDRRGNRAGLFRDDCRAWLGAAEGPAGRHLESGDRRVR